MRKNFPIGSWLALCGSIAVIGILSWLLTDTATFDNEPVIGYGLRGGIVIFSLIACIAYRSTKSNNLSRVVFLGDGIHELTAPLHFYLAEQPALANLVLIVSSACIDMMGIFLVFAGVFGPTMRPFAALAILFLLRRICRMCCTLPLPPSMIWRNPGFPSLFVSYQVTNELFFSSHTAIAVLGAIEAVQLFPWWLGTAAVVIAAGEVLVVLVLRAHYTLGVITAVFAAFCAAGLANWLAELIAEASN